MPPSAEPVSVAAKRDGEAAAAIPFSRSASQASMGQAAATPFATVDEGGSSFFEDDVAPGGCPRLFSKSRHLNITTEQQSGSEVAT